MDYNEFRPHDSLGDKTPMEFMPRTFKTEISSFELSALWGSLRLQLELPAEFPSRFQKKTSVSINTLTKCL